MANFATWTQENLAKFAQEANDKLIAQHERIEQLQRKVKDVLVEKRQWVGLTGDEVSKIIDDEIGFNSCWGPEESFAAAIEAKLQSKNI